MPQKQPKISGTWRSTFEEDGKECHELVKVEQDGTKIKGTIELIDEETVVYPFSAIFDNGIIRGLYWSDDESYFERGAFVMKQSGNKTFNGQYIFSSRSSLGKDIKGSDYAWKKQNVSKK